MTNRTISRLLVIKFYSRFLFSNCLQWGWYWWKYVKSLLSDPLFISRLIHDVSLCICGWIHHHLQIHSELYSLECVEDISAVRSIIYLQVRTDIHWNVLKMIYTILLGVCNMFTLSNSVLNFPDNSSSDVLGFSFVFPPSSINTCVCCLYQNLDVDPRWHILSVSDITCNSSTEVLYLLLLYFRFCLSLWWCSWHALVSTGNTWCYLFRETDHMTNRTISRLFVIKFYSRFLFSNCLQWGRYWWK